MAAPPRAFSRSLAKSGPSRPIHAASSYLLNTVQISAQRPTWRRSCGIEASFMVVFGAARRPGCPPLIYVTPTPNASAVGHAPASRGVAATVHGAVICDCRHESFKDG